ncbi:catalase-like domain-containing protein [Amylostereum chailletii]|nr:catalase-like domain-containing protein [Amylostereum chailletii]
MNHQRDGQHQSRIVKGQVNYWPNRMGHGAPVPPSEGGYHEFAQKVAGIKQRVRGEKFQEHLSQAQLFYNSLTPYEKAHLIAAISFELSHCDDPVVYETYTKLLPNIDFELARAVATNVGGIVPDKPVRENHGRTSAPLSQLYYAPKKPTIKSRRIAVLITDGFNASEVTAVRAALEAGGALTFIIAPRRGMIAKEGGGDGLGADHHFEGQRSTLFDAIYIPNGDDKFGETLRNNGRVVHWVQEAFGHCKAIGAVGEGGSPIASSLSLFR